MCKLYQTRSGSLSNKNIFDLVFPGQMLFTCEGNRLRVLFPLNGLRILWLNTTLHKNGHLITLCCPWKRLSENLGYLIRESQNQERGQRLVCSQCSHVWSGKDKARFQYWPPSATLMCPVSFEEFAIDLLLPWHLKELYSGTQRNNDG
jgi:uncharacterized protein YbaR (Trm112 family)